MGLLREGEHALAAHGVADVRTGVATTTATPFAVGSLTKSMVATVVAGLATEGRLSLDEAVATYVPEVEQLDWARRASVRTMMANRSDIPLRTAWEFGFEERPEDDADALRRLVADLGPSEATSGAAGGHWSYSNAGWCVLGRLVETVTGLSWEEAMRSRLGGLQDTSYGVMRAVGCATGHEDSAAGPVPVTTVPSRAYAPAGTTTVSTAADLLRLAGWHLEEPGLAALRDVQAEVRINGWLDAWCLGWARFDWVPERAWGWDGLIDGQRSFLRLLPERRAALVLLTNSSRGRVLYRTLVPRLVKELFGIDVPAPQLQPTPGAAGELARFAGRYAWPDHEVVVRATDEALTIADGERTVEARPVDDRTFLVDLADPDNPTTTFGAFDAAGRPEAVYEMLWSLPRVAD
jgi:CubicO group peptidase (beta-lactamase class C family)